VRKTWLIFKREYLTRVKSKGFVIGTLLIPFLGIVSVVLVAFLASYGSKTKFRIAIVDNMGGLGESVAQELDTPAKADQPFTVTQSIDRPGSSGAVEDGLRAQVNSRALDAYLVIPASLSQRVELHTRNPGNFGVIAPITAAVNEALIEARLSARGIHVKDLSDVTRDEGLRVIKVSAGGEAVEKGQTIGVAIGLVVLLYMSLLMYGIMTMRSVLEEKTSRTMEVLISSVQPFQLLTGKILGVAGVAFTQFLIWIASLGLLLSYGAVMAATFNPASSFPAIHIPFLWRIFSLFRDVRRNWSGLFHRSGRSSIAVAGYGAARLHHDDLLDRSQRSFVEDVSGPFRDTVVFAGADADAHLDSVAACLAVGSLGGPVAPRHLRRDLSFGQGLPHRRPHVRQAPDAPRPNPLGPLFLSFAELLPLATKL
jgi:hypothetical protein